MKEHDDSVQWNQFNKVVQSHRDGTIYHLATNEMRTLLGLPVPWTPEMGDLEVHQPGLEITQAVDARKAHMELVMAVARKFPDENRHQTALRYIQEAERNCISGPSQEPEQCAQSPS